MKEFVILLIVTHTPYPMAMVIGKHLVRCCRLLAGKKAMQGFSSNLSLETEKKHPSLETVLYT